VTTTEQESTLRARKPVEAVTAEKKGKRAVKKISKEDAARYRSDGFWRDLRTGKWMLIPSECRTGGE
jgi:hypothetical protein